MTRAHLFCQLVSFRTREGRACPAECPVMHLPGCTLDVACAWAHALLLAMPDSMFGS